MGVVKDDSQSLIKTVKDVSSFDMAVFSGGSSVGSRDLFSSVIEELGVVHFHGLQVKPGKPTLFGVVQNMPIFGMPGYPTSCLSNAYIFLAPALRKMAGLASNEMRKVIGRLSQEIRVSGDREQFYTVKLEEGVVTPVFKQSGDITSMAYANGLIIIPIGTKRIANGAEVEVALLE